LRGRVHHLDAVRPDGSAAQVPVVVTYHPAYLLRSLADKAKAWEDLCLARDTYSAAPAD
jgi:DNA polymerase